MKQKVYTVKDFDFKPHGVIGGAVVDTFEIAAWSTDTGDWTDLGDDDAILRYVPKDKIPFIILDLLKK